MFKYNDVKLVFVRFTGHVGHKALEGLRKLGKQQLY